MGGIDPSDGWFGVPYGNFYAWLFVTFGFSLLTRWLRDAARTRSSPGVAAAAGPLPGLRAADRWADPVHPDQAADRLHAGWRRATVRRWPCSSSWEWRYGRWPTTAANRTAAGWPSWTCAWRPGRGSRSTATSWPRCWSWGSPTTCRSCCSSPSCCCWPSCRWRLLVRRRHARHVAHPASAGSRGCRLARGRVPLTVMTDWDRATGECVELLRDLIRIPSVNPPGVPRRGRRPRLDRRRDRRSRPLRRGAERGRASRPR